MGQCNLANRHLAAQTQAFLLHQLLLEDLSVQVIILLEATSEITRALPEKHSAKILTLFLPRDCLETIISHKTTLKEQESLASQNKIKLVSLLTVLVIKELVNLDSLLPLLAV